MKRIIALLLAALLMVSCALADVALHGYDAKSGYVYVTLGQCPQDADGGIEPIVWRVLSVEDGRAYLLSEYVLEARPIHSDYQEYANKPTNKKKPGFNGDFTQTEMSRYLCGDFAQNCFTDDERAMLTPDDTFGLFFLASDADLKNKAYGFTSNESRKAWGTPYALANGLFKYGSQAIPPTGRAPSPPPTPATHGASSPGASWGASTSSRWTRECGPRAICL
jgi:hypothetical protein